jgi:hypothetical protein
LVFFRDTESIVSGLDYVYWSTLVQYFVWMVLFIKFLRKWYHCDYWSYCFFEVHIWNMNTSHIHDLAKFMFGFSIWLIFGFHL